MSYDLYLKKPGANVTPEEFSTALSEIEVATEGVKFNKIGDTEWEMSFQDADVGAVGLTDQVVLSTNSHLVPFIEYLAARLSEKLNVPVYDPQETKEVQVADIKITLDDLKKKHQKIFAGEEKKITFVSSKSEVDGALLFQTVSNQVGELFPDMPARLPESPDTPNFTAMINDKDGKPAVLVTCMRKMGPVELPEQVVRIALRKPSLEDAAKKLADTIASALGVTFTREEEY